MTLRLSHNLPWLGALVAVLLFGAGLWMATYEDSLYRNQQIKDTTEQAQILAASVSAAVAFQDQAAAQEYVDALRVNPELIEAAVYDTSHHRLAQFARNGRYAPPTPDDIYVEVPVIQRGRGLGTVALEASAEPRERRLVRYAGLILLATMGALVIVVLGFSAGELEKRAEQLSAANVRLAGEMREREKTEEALRQSQKLEAVGQLSGGIAHDFNNLIMIVKGNLKLMRKRFPTQTTEANQYVVAAEEALDRAAKLTQRILAFARRQPLAPQPVNLSALVKNLSDLFEYSFDKGIKVELDLHAKWFTLCDTNQMENAILNMAINARDAMPDGGIIRVSTRDVRYDSMPTSSDIPAGDYIELAITDTGCGMDEATRSRAFDPFFTTKPFGKGTGLGLSMAYGFVKQSGGNLSLESTPGFGTKVTILMPRIEEAQ